MNNRFLAAAGIGACAAACAASLALPAILGAGALGAGSLAAFETGLGTEFLVVVAAALAVTGAFIWRRSRRAKATCASDGSCGCKPAQGDITPQRRIAP